MKNKNIYCHSILKNPIHLFILICLIAFFGKFLSASNQEFFWTINRILIAYSGDLRITLTGNTAMLPPHLKIELKHPQTNSMAYSALKSPILKNLVFFTGLAPGRYQLQITNENLPKIQQEIEIRSGLELDLKVKIPEYVHFKGIVLLESGDPVNQARLTLTQTDSQHILQQAISNTGGIFTFYAVSKGMYDLSIDHVAFCRHFERIRIDQPEKSLMRLFQLETGQSVNAVVTNEANQPVTAAKMRIFQEDLLLDIKTTYSDETGKVSIKGLQPLFTKVEITHPLYLPLILNLEIKPESLETNLFMVLKKGFNLRGTIINENQLPVKDALVTLKFSSPDILEKTRNSSAQGNFQFTIIPAGSATLSISHPDYFDYHAPIIINKNLRLAEPIVLKPSHFISGKIMEADGSAATEITLILRGEGNHINFREKKGTIDSNGEFRFNHLEYGNYTLHIFNESLQFLEKTIKDIPANTKDLQIRLSARQLVSGIIQDEQLQPLPEVTVSLRLLDVDNQPFGEIYQKSTVSDATGKFSLNIRFMSELRIKFEKSQYITHKEHVNYDEQSKSIFLSIILKKGVSVSGRLLDQSTEIPISDMWIIGKANPVYYSSFFQKSSGSNHSDCLTNELGEFTLTGLQPGQLTIQVFDNTAKKSILKQHVIHLTNEDIKDLTIFVQQNGRLKVQALDTNARPMAHCQILIYAEDFQNYPAQQLSILTNDQGIAESDSMKPGNYLIGIKEIDDNNNLYGLGRLTSMVIHANRLTEITLTKSDQESSIMNGTVYLNQRPIAGGIIVFSPTDPDQLDQSMIKLLSQGRKADIGEDGTFVIDRLAAGTYQYTVHNQGGSGKITIEENQQYISIHLDGFTLSGTVVNENDQPVTNTYIQLFPQSSSHIQNQIHSLRTHSDAAGNFQFSNLTTGSYRLQTFYGSSGLSYTEQIEIIDRSVSVVLRLKPGFKLSGLIASAEDNRPLANAYVYLFQNNHVYTVTNTNEDGEYNTRESISQGEYLIYVYASGFALDIQSLLITENTRHTVRLTAAGSVEIRLKSSTVPIHNRYLTITDASGMEIQRQPAIQFSSRYFSAIALMPTNEQGLTKIDNLAPGTYHVSVKDLSIAKEFRIQAGTTTYLDIEL
jgi:hypothetical protein